MAGGEQHVARCRWRSGPDCHCSLRTGGRVVEGTGLENRRARKGLVSSNLTLSVARRLSGGRRLVKAETAVTTGSSPAASGSGWVAEWLKAHAWKACGLERVS